MRFKNFFDFKKNKGFFTLIHDGSLKEKNFKELTIGSADSVTDFLLKYSDSVILYGAGAIKHNNEIEKYYFNKEREPSIEDSTLLEKALELLKEEHLLFMKNSPA